MTPACFDELVIAIQNHSVFQNFSNNPQMPVREQLAICLFRLGHHGNAMSGLKVSLWAGIGYGTVQLVTKRVMLAVCDERFRKITIPWPTAEEREQAKIWVEGRSCPAWRDGWCMVDGTLVPLFQRPHHYGNAFFDRKSNYSLNVQVCSSVYIEIMNLQTQNSHSLFRHQTSELLTMVLAYLVASMMLPHGSKLVFHMNMMSCCHQTNSFGQTLHIHSNHGVRLLTKS